MKGSDKVITALNKVLANQLTAINQYFLHARMLQNWGLQNIGSLEYKTSITEMKNADEVIKRILFLEGLPNLQKLNRLKIGQNIEEIIKADLDLEIEAVELLKKLICQMEIEQDYVTRELFEKILEGGEEHIDWLETQQELLIKVGSKNYMQSQIDMD
jgi:bacterioferritin